MSLSNYWLNVGCEQLARLKIFLSSVQTVCYLSFECNKMIGSAAQLKTRWEDCKKGDRSLINELAGCCKYGKVFLQSLCAERISFKWLEFKYLDFESKRTVVRILYSTMKWSVQSLSYPVIELLFTVYPHLFFYIGYTQQLCQFMHLMEFHSLPAQALCLC